VNDWLRDQEYTLPASPWFIGLTLFCALALSWLPWSGGLLVLRPDFTALILLYWCTHRPNQVGLGVSWLVGILADVADASMFGQHALAYTVLAFGGILMHRRIQLFDLRQQILQAFPLLLLSYLIYAGVHWQVRGYVAWSYFIGSATTAALWIPLALLLQAVRQHRASDDEL
jgi:rod shape-determining protein MreD